MRRRKSSYEPDAHFLAPGTVDGWFVCTCGCGYVTVCAHCLPQWAGRVPGCYCDAEGVDTEADNSSV